jgi:AdoMet-dependent heme synthase
LARQGLSPLIDEARSLGISVSLTPAATPKLTRAMLARLNKQGVEELGLNLIDGRAARFDSRHTRNLRTHAQGYAMEDLEMPLQVNSLVAAQTAFQSPCLPLPYLFRAKVLVRLMA